MKHTLGPWKTARSTVYDQVETLDGELICFASMRENSKANARLIAAAPELLEACKTALKCIKACCEGIIPIATISILENEIIKATGDNP